MSSELAALAGLARVLASDVDESALGFSAAARGLRGALGFLGAAFSADFVVVESAEDDAVEVLDEDDGDGDGDDVETAALGAGACDACATFCAGLPLFAAGAEFCGALLGVVALFLGAPSAC